jgi:hypothetical protein
LFDLSDESITRIKKDTPIDRLESADPVEAEEAEDPLDSEKGQELHARLISYYRQELTRQEANRFQQALDEDYYDNEQWSEADAQTLRDRGQAPLVYNVIAQSVNWIIGSEKRGRTDFKILPRGKEDAKPAEGKTKFLKYLSDVNRTPFHRSRAFEEAVKVGIGWLECGVQDEDDGEPLYDRYESWRNMLHDSASTELDGSDMRYLFRSKWVDEDIANALFPGRKAQIASAVSDTTLFGGFDAQDGDFPMDNAEFDREDNAISGAVAMHKRRRVRLIEAWFRMPEKVSRIRGGAFSGQIYDEEDPRHQETVAAGQGILVEKVMMRTRVAIMTTGDLLYEGSSPYRHNRFPFVAIWGFRRGKNGLPYGVIRGMRDIQDDVNKRASKAQHILSTNKVIMDEGAVDDMDAFAEEVSRPDAIIVKKTGKSIELNVDRELSTAHLDLMSRSIGMIQQVGGVTDELLGRSTNAVSGIAVQRRQEQGSVATNKLFDNLRLAVQLQGELELSLIEQYVTAEKQFRITNERGTPEFLTVNDGLPENDITRTKADFVISEAEWRATMREAAAQQLSDMIAKMPPQIAIVLLDLVVESMDLPNRDELVKRIRQVNGMRDPDATEMTPEEQAAISAQAEAAAAQQAMMEAELAEKLSKTDKTEAETARIKRQMINDSVTATSTAMLAATSVIQMPTIAKVADNILVEAGWHAVHAAQGLPPMPQQAPMPPMQPPMQPGVAPNGMMPPQQPQPQQGAI